MRIEVKKELSGISAARWDDILPRSEIFHSHAFIDAISRAKVEGARMEFVLFWEGDQLVGTSVLSDFEINLDLFLGEARIVKWIKKVSPRFFKIRVLFCGTPLSAGHHNLYLKDPSSLPEALDLLSAYMDGYCKRHKVKYSVFKEFLEQDTQPIHAALRRHAYFKGFSLPSTELALPFPDYPAYLSALRAKYRRQILTSQKKIGGKPPLFVPDYFSGPMEESHPVFTLLKTTEFDPREFYRLYMQVMARATVKLEVLNQAFFEHFFEAMQEEVRLLAMVWRGEVLGVFVFARVDTTLTFIWTGKVEEKDSHDTYFNLMNALFYHALESGCDKIVLGQTSYYAKQRFGGKVKELFLYFKCHQGLKHWVLEKLNAQLFPPLELPELRVFKEGEGIT